LRKHKNVEVLDPGYWNHCGSTSRYNLRCRRGVFGGAEAALTASSANSIVRAPWLTSSRWPPDAIHPFTGRVLIFGIFPSEAVAGREGSKVRTATDGASADVTGVYLPGKNRLLTVNGFDYASSVQ
jgi:hypothetical protein